MRSGSGQIYKEFPVHHSSSDGILVQLPDGAGFGRLTKESLGGDKLGEALFKSFASRSLIPLIATRRRDRHGYRLMTVELAESWNELITYPLPVRSMVSQLLKKHFIKGLGTTTSARVVRESPKGVIFNIHPHMMGFAILEHLRVKPASDGSSDSVEVRLLNYDAKENVLNVTADSGTVERTPLDTDVSSCALSTLHCGQRVEGVVILSSTDDNCAVVEIMIDSNELHCSLLGYYIFDWAEGTDDRSTSSCLPPAVGSHLLLTVELVAETRFLQDAMPFIILSHREFFSRRPATRQPLTFNLTRGLVGPFPWRESCLHRNFGLGSIHEAGETESDEDESHSHEDEGSTRLRRRKVEEAVDAFERQMEEATPTSPEDFQRLLLSSPNSSYLWTQYMAHYVKLQKLEDARQVAEKALHTIAQREDEQRLNVWVAYMNLENLYGTAESLHSIFKRALPSQADPLVLHERLADIFEASRKSQQLLTLCRTMTSQWKYNPRTWERLGKVLIDQNKRDQLKRTIKEMGEHLKKDQASMVIVRLAVKEYKQGSVENGRALLEGLLSKIPKKSDVWMAYIDQEVGLMSRRASQASLMNVRQVFERAATMNFSAKVTQLLFTKYLNFEKIFGTTKEVEKVKQMARNYVEAKIQAVAQPGVSPSL